MCIYDSEIVHPFIDIAQYLKFKKVTFKNKMSDNINAKTVIIDRRHNDKMYIIKDEVELNELFKNYSISLQFECCDEVIRCYLFYQNKTRFFAEYLTTFIPRLFVKKQRSTCLIFARVRLLQVICVS